MQEIRHHYNKKESYMNTFAGCCNTRRCNRLFNPIHLTKLGYKDVALLERHQLTFGSTWYAAANFHGLQHCTNIS